jgi:hypothetical protein
MDAMRKAYKIVFGNLGRPRHKCDNNIKIDPEEIGRTEYDFLRSYLGED